MDEVREKINAALLKATTLNVSGSLSAAYYLGILLKSQHATNAMKQLMKTKTNHTDPVIIAILLILERIDKELTIAEGNILDGARSAPFYGLIFCIRHLLEKSEMEYVDFQLFAMV